MKGLRPKAARFDSFPIYDMHDQNLDTLYKTQTCFRTALQLMQTDVEGL